MFFICATCSIALGRFVFAAVFAAFAAAVGLARFAARVIFFAADVADVSDRARDYAFLLLNLDRSDRKQNHNAAACASRLGQSLHNRSRIYITPASAAAAAVVAAAVFAVLLAAVVAVVAAARFDVVDCAAVVAPYTALRSNAATLYPFAGAQQINHAPGRAARAGHFLAAAIEFAAFLICDLFC